MSGEDAFTGLRRVCPHCGEASQTLGSQCPSCGRTYVKRSLTDRLPSDEFWLIALSNPRLLILVLIVLGYLVYLLVTGQLGDLI